MSHKDWLYLYNLEEHFALQELMQRQQDLPPSGTTMIIASTANGHNTFNQYLEDTKLDPSIAWFKEEGTNQ